MPCAIGLASIAPSNHEQESVLADKERLLASAEADQLSVKFRGTTTIVEKREGAASDSALLWRYYYIVKDLFTFPLVGVEFMLDLHSAYAPRRRLCLQGVVLVKCCVVQCLALNRQLGCLHVGSGPQRAAGSR